MENTYNIQQFGKLIEKSTRTLQKRDREGKLVAHRDRFVRFGYSYFEPFCERCNTQIIVVNGAAFSPEQELVQDVLAITTMFFARLHGLRSYKKGVERCGFAQR